MDIEAYGSCCASKTSLMACFILLQEYNPEVIRAVLDELTPSKLRIMWSSKTFKGATDSVEPVYGTEYSSVKIPEEWIKRWTNPEHDDRQVFGLFNFPFTEYAYVQSCLGSLVK